MSKRSIVMGKTKIGLLKMEKIVPYKKIEFIDLIGIAISIVIVLFLIFYGGK